MASLEEAVSVLGIPKRKSPRASRRFCEWRSEALRVPYCSSEESPEPWCGLVSSPGLKTGTDWCRGNGVALLCRHISPSSPEAFSFRLYLLLSSFGSDSQVNKFTVCFFQEKTIRVWLKRDSGQYWPSIYHTMASPCSAMTYHHDSRRIFVGQDNGAVMEFHVSEDFNKMNFIKTYPAHQNRVSAIIFSLTAEWVISTGHDKCVSWMCTRSGNMLGRHSFTSWASCLQYPSQAAPSPPGAPSSQEYDFDTQYAFVGDYSGQITLLKLEQSTCSVITTLKGHEGSIACLWWDPVQRLLFSGASDNSIIMWDIGGRKGRTLLLQGHHDRVQSLCYLQLTRQLVSCSSDGGIAVWNMDVSREEAPQWLESDSCQKCEQPFFWNIKQMWDTKTLGLRQHHCRKCGQAVCGRCSSRRSSYPLMGFELQVRVCDSCYESIKDEDRTSLATFHEGKHNISHMSMDVARGLMVTCGTDRVVKVTCFIVAISIVSQCRLRHHHAMNGEKKWAFSQCEDTTYKLFSRFNELCCFITTKFCSEGRE
ncbi:hypothetical protein HPG69_019086 [Diceros bicornis minor]|uniref:FYVE-type domain-containing protein n=1 Tax=Diceros bicornis minor TaxID=77932 RepID=A0A7J7EJI6_DICBM|nr:hypothetical protein HPG69_019086 [Diceros bicornis minor]